MTYPCLTRSQQQDLPVLIQSASPIPAKFEDSTHQLWYCETVDGPMVLKCCNQQTIQDSSFWRGINHLFGIDFPRSLANIDKTHYFLNEEGLLDIPEFIASEASAFVLARYVEGADVDLENVSDDMVIQLAEHIGQLHHHKHSHWGAFHQAEFPALQWPSALQESLTTLAKLHPVSIPKDIIKQALQQAPKLRIDSLVPIMLDLRWDQMLHQQGKLTAIVDMDAVVIGPKELELVLLEYQLNQHQAKLFAQAYQQHTKWPDLTEQRYSYRLLLFLMNSLGETDINKWMDAAIRW